MTAVDPFRTVEALTNNFIECLLLSPIAAGYRFRSNAEPPRIESGIYAI